MLKIHGENGKIHEFFMLMNKTAPAMIEIKIPAYPTICAVLALLALLFQQMPRCHG